MKKIFKIIIGFIAYLIIVPFIVVIYSFLYLALLGIEEDSDIIEKPYFVSLKRDVFIFLWHNIVLNTR